MLALFVALGIAEGQKWQIDAGGQRWYVLPEIKNLYGKELIGYVSPWTQAEWRAAQEEWQDYAHQKALLQEELIYVFSPYLSCWMPVPDEGGYANQYIGKGERFV